MASSVRLNYLTTEVTTASPQKLHLMVIEAAITSARLAQEKWRSHKDDEALEAILHSQELINELICGLKTDSGPDLVRRVAPIYLFIFRSLVEAGYRRDEQKLADAVRVLEIERETWRQVCKRLAGHSATKEGSGVPPPLGLHLSGPKGLDSMPASGISLEA